MKTLVKLFIAVFLSVLVFEANAFEGLNDDVSLKIFNRINCGTGILCERKGKGIFNMELDKQVQVAATATTITESQCGATFINSGAVVMNLPEASEVLGCRLTFVTNNASNFDVNPDDADQILALTNAAGDAIRNATVGNSVTLEAISASGWTAVAINGTYTDVN